MLNDNQCPICKGLGKVDTSIGLLECNACDGVGLKACKGDFELVGYLTGEVYDSYPVFLSVEKLQDYDIDVSDMMPVYVLL
jgi:hypothetical protein